MTPAINWIPCADEFPFDCPERAPLVVRLVIVLLFIVPVAVALDVVPV
ncbi:MAG: hypothetical protein IPP63_16135 [Chloracidobacterium sp.]|nr:hypothetical protein [Chloracidobacterium sp.]